MNKKGFTLIEIIICIVLLIAISSGIVITVSKSNSSNKEYQKVKDQLLEVANVYLSIEKDEKGNTYQQGIFYGGNAVFIPINDLYDKGYIDDKIISTLEQDDNYKKASKKYLLASVFKETDSVYNTECKGNVIEFKTSWENKLKDNTTYLCSYGSGDSKGTSSGGVEQYETIIDAILANRENIPKLDIDSAREFNFYITRGAGDSYSKIHSSKENGLCKKEDGTYFFRGIVEDNYAKVGDILFRILNINNETISLIRDSSLTIDSTSVSMNDKEISKFQENVSKYIKENVLGFETGLQSGQENGKSCVYLSECIFGGNFFKKFGNKIYDLPNTEELEYAGVKNGEYDVTSYFGGRTWTDTLEYGVSFLSSGGSFVINCNNCTGGIDYSGYYPAYGISGYGVSYGAAETYPDISDSYYSFAHNVITPIYSDYANDATDIEILFNAIRPVLEINLSEINFEGVGTKNNPYILKPKNCECT